MRAAHDSSRIQSAVDDLIDIRLLLLNLLFAIEAALVGFGHDCFILDCSVVRFALTHKVVLDIILSRCQPALVSGLMLLYRTIFLLVYERRFL